MTDFKAIMHCIHFLVISLLIVFTNSLVCKHFPFDVPPTLVTERLILRPLTLDDTKALFTLTSNKQATHYTPFIFKKTEEETLLYVQEMLDRYKNGEIIFWLICDKQFNEMIGFVMIFDFSYSRTRAEIGYMILPQYWNKGYATEAAKKIIDFGFKTLNLVRIQAMVYTLNFAGNRVPEKCNMQCEGVLRSYKVHPGEPPYDMKMYAIINEA